MANVITSSGSGLNYPKWQSGFYYSTPSYGTTTRSLTNQELQCAPIFVPNAVTLSEIDIEVTTIGSTGSVIRLGIYNDNGGIPGSLLLDAGTVNAALTAVDEKITISQALTPGLYWLAGCGQGTPLTAPIVRSQNGGLALSGGPENNAPTYQRACWSQYGVTGALPNPFTGTALDAGDFMYVQVKVA